MILEDNLLLPIFSLLSSLQLRASAPTFPAAASSVSSKLANFLLSLAANARQHTRAARPKRKRGVLVSLLCPPPPFLSPVLRGQKTGRRVALVESPSRSNSSLISKALIARFSLPLPEREDARVVDLSRLMRLGSRSGYYGPYRWLALKKRMARSMSRPRLLAEGALFVLAVFLSVDSCCI